jgi:hypothetical protein
LNQAKQLADELSAVGKPLEDDDLISFIISGINPMFTPFVTASTLCDHAMTFLDFQSELLSHEILLQNQQHTVTLEAGPFALYANRPNQSHSHPNHFRKPKFFSRTTPNSQPRHPQFSPWNHSSPPNRPPASHQVNSPFSAPQAPWSPCQICGKRSHKALDCYHRMDYAYQGRHPPTQLAAMVAHTNGDLETQDWLADSGANTHVTADQSNISDAQPFAGADTVGMGNGAGLDMHSIGSSIVHSNATHPTPLFLKDILHCLSASANLLSINKFCKDNHCWFALTDTHFIVNDNLTGTVLLQRPSENGPYPIPLHRNSMNKLKGFAAFLGVKTTDMVWHQRLGHPSASVFQLLFRHQNLPLVVSFNKSRVCESCQLGKSKQLPFSESNRISTSPLELIHSNVWTSPIPSLSGCKFYVLFIDDYS